MLPDAQAEHYRTQQRITLQTLAAVRRSWALVGEDFDAGWRRAGARIEALVTAGQLAAARDAAASVPAVLAELGTPVESVAAVRPQAFAGTASDGRSLEGLLVGAKVTAKQAVERGAPVVDALAAGRKWLDMAVQTQVADAARQAASVGIAVRPTVGWVRQVNPPCCSRCAVLAGKWFRWNAGFQRHPGCDCRHIPAPEDVADDVTTDPKALFREGQVTGLRDAQRKAIADGADPILTINADRGRSADGMYTTEGTTRRGYASQVRRELDKQRGALTNETATNVGRRGAVGNYVVRRTGPRPTPDAIYKYAESREEAVRLLAANGYVLGEIRAVARSAL